MSGVWCCRICSIRPPPKYHYSYPPLASLTSTRLFICLLKCHDSCSSALDNSILPPHHPQRGAVMQTFGMKFSPSSLLPSSSGSSSSPPPSPTASLSPYMSRPASSYTFSSTSSSSSSLRRGVLTRDFSFDDIIVPKNRRVRTSPSCSTALRVSFCVRVVCADVSLCLSQPRFDLFIEVIPFSHR